MLIQCDDNAKKKSLVFILILVSSMVCLLTIGKSVIAQNQMEVGYSGMSPRSFTCSNEAGTGSINLIPDKIGQTANYWCTWKTQSYTIQNTVAGEKTERWEKLNNLSEAHVFGKAGWAYTMFPTIRNNLYLLFDDGWEVRYDSSRTGHDRDLMGTMVLAEDKFPSCTGTPAERLKKLNQLCKEAGWRGAGLWIPAQASGERDKAGAYDSTSLEHYFRERFSWCKYAGIEYLKVDWGYHMTDERFRSMLTLLAKELCPELVVEHAAGTPPLNDYGCPWCSTEFRQTGRFKECEMGKTFAKAKRIIPVSNVYRIYDTSEPLNIATTIDRVAEILKEYSGKSAISTVLNCEYAAYIGASLGCAIGLMNVPTAAKTPGLAQLKYDEAVRAVNWFKIAPAFAIGYGTNYIDTLILTDSHIFKAKDSWIYWLNGQSVIQSAPAVVSRNIPLPKVSGSAEFPFVMASRNPNGAITIATLERKSSKRGAYFPLVDVTIEAGNSNNPIGIFGRYKSLTLQFNNKVSGKRVFAQDLAADTATDITSVVTMNGNKLLLRGEVIRKIGLSAASFNDVSEAGMMIVVK